MQCSYHVHQVNPVRRGGILILTEDEVYMKARLFLLLLGLTLFWAPILVLLQFGFPINYFLDIPTLATVFGGSTLILILKQKPRPVLLAIGHLGLIEDNDLSQLTQSLVIWRNFGIILIVFGGIFTLYQLCKMLPHTWDPNVLSIVLIFSYNAILYGIFMATVIAFPAYLIIEKRLERLKLHESV